MLYSLHRWVNVATIIAEPVWWRFRVLGVAMFPLTICLIALVVFGLCGWAVAHVGSREDD